MIDLLLISACLGLTVFVGLDRWSSSRRAAAFCLALAVVAFPGAIGMAVSYFR